MRTRIALTALLLVNIAAHLGGSTGVLGDSGAQGALDRLNLKSLNTQQIDTMLRTAQGKTYEDYAQSMFGYSRDDLAKLDAGYLVLPQGQDLGELTPLEMTSKLQAARDELTLEQQRAQQAVTTSFEAIATQRYLDGVHESLEESYDEAVELSIENLKDQIKQVTQYLSKFPAVATACT